MTRREALIVVGFLLFPIFFIGLLTLTAIVLTLLPREYTRQLRRRLAGFVMWQWMKGMKVSRIAHDWLWDAGNGKPYDYSEIG